MLADIGKILRTAWKFVTTMEVPKLPLLTGAEQTKRSWAKVLESYKEVPEIYKDFLQTLPGDTLPYMVLTPSYEGFISRTNEKLLCNLDDKIFIVEKVKDEMTSICYSFEDINYVEVGSILLKSWIKVSGVAGGALTSSTLKFNSVTEYMFNPILVGIRSATNSSEGADLGTERAKFDYLQKLNFKFMNYARRSIMPGEKVLDTVLQPEIRAEIARLLGMSLLRIVSPAHLSILTDKELITIRDEATRLWEKGARHGGIWNYIPLGRITSVSLARREDNLFTLSIHLPENDRIDSLFSASNEREVRQFLDQLEDLIPGSRARHMVA